MSITVKRPEGAVEFCTDLALREQWEKAVERLNEARKDETDRRLADTSVAEAAAEVQRLEAAMKAATLRFRIKAMPRRRWQELGEEHQPREGNQQDAAMGVNVSTFFDAVALESIFAVNESVSDKVVDFDVKAEWMALADEMTDGQYKEFVNEFLALNRGVTKAPFSRTASLVTRLSEENSSSPNDSESATSG